MYTSLWGGSRCSKIRNYWNIFITFLVSGIWHGANWTFVVWGILHGCLQIIEKILGLHRKQSRGFSRLARILITFLLVNFAWIIFRMPTIGDAWNVIGKIFTDLASPILMASKTNSFLSFGAIITVIIVDLVNEFLPENRLMMYSPNRMVRWGTYIVLAFVILLCGVFDAGQFIYVSF